MLGLLVYIICVLLVVALAFFIIGKLSVPRSDGGFYIPPPIPMILYAIIIVFVVIWLLDLLVGFSGIGYHGTRRLL